MFCGVSNATKCSVTLCCLPNSTYSGKQLIFCISFIRGWRIDNYLIYVSLKEHLIVVNGSSILFDEVVNK